MAYVQLPNDGAGKQVETNTPDGTTHRQVMTVGDKTTAANTLAIDSSGRATVLVATNPVLVRETDGTNPITKTFDADTSGVTHEYVAGVSLRKGASGGSVEAFTSTNPGRIDPTGTTVQPVSGTVTANQGGTWNVGTLSTVTNVVHVDDNSGSLTVDGTVTANAGTGTFAVSAASLPLPTGASTAAKQPALGTAGTPSADVISVQGVAGGTAVPVSGTFWQATQPVSGTFWQATQPVSIAAAVAVTDNSGSLTVDNGGTFAVQAAQSGTWTVQPGNTANSTPWLVSQVPATSGGCSISHLVSAASTNPTVIKNSPGQVFGWNIHNAAQHPIYVKFHNQTTSPTAGTGVVHTIGVQAGTGREYWNGAGIAFGTGIAMTIVTGIADADNTAVAASDCVVDIYYK